MVGVAQPDYLQPAAERAAIRADYLRSERPASAARGIHHTALICSDIRRTVEFYSGVLEFPLTEMVDNPDDRGSTQVFFDVGNGNLLAFVDRPDLDPAALADVLGGLHHIAISVEPVRWSQLKANLDAAGVDYQMESGTSVCFRDPDGARLELIADPLGDVDGTRVL
jgi:catechol 2,3-dioxygenase-like lactoylglutathione lyase family enzyme